MNVAGQLKRFPLFENLAEEQLVAVASELSSVTVSPGEAVFRAGDHGDAMGLLASGKLSVHVRQDGADVVVGSVYPLEIVGEMSCIEPAPRTATVVADVESEVLFLSRDGLSRISESSPDVGVALRREILRLLTARLREVDARLEMAYSAGAGSPAGDEEDVTPEVLRSVRLLQGFSEAELRALITVAPPRFYSPGHVLCRAGETGDAAFIITRGAVEVSLGGVGDEHVVTTLGPGSIVGQMSLVTGEPRTATLTVQQRSLVLTLAAKDFNSLLAANSSFAVRFQIAVIRAAIAQLAAANRRLATTGG